MAGKLDVGVKVDTSLSLRSVVSKTPKQLKNVKDFTVYSGSVDTEKSNQKLMSPSPTNVSKAKSLNQVLKEVNSSTGILSKDVDVIGGSAKKPTTEDTSTVFKHRSVVGSMSKEHRKLVLKLMSKFREWHKMDKSVKEAAEARQLKRIIAKKRSTWNTVLDGKSKFDSFEVV